MIKIPQAFVLTSFFIISACSDSAPNSSQNTQNDARSTPASTQNQDVTSVKADSAPLTAEEIMLDKGRKLFARCKTCHTLNEGGRQKVGPNLWNMFGQKAGAMEGFPYSKAMAASEIVWTEKSVSAYIENPREFMPGNRMTFVGLRKAEDREALITYLRQQTTPEQ